jgi:hypothetical protein
MTEMDSSSYDFQRVFPSQHLAMYHHNTVVSLPRWYVRSDLTPMLSALYSFRVKMQKRNSLTIIL